MFSCLRWYKIFLLIHGALNECDLLSAQCISSTGQIIKSVCVSVSQSVRSDDGVNGSRIGNQPWAIDWHHHDLWCWMTLTGSSSRSLQLQSNILITVWSASGLGRYTFLWNVFVVYRVIYCGPSFGVMFAVVCVGDVYMALHVMSRIMACVDVSSRRHHSLPIRYHLSSLSLVHVNSRSPPKWAMYTRCPRQRNKTTRYMLRLTLINSRTRMRMGSISLLMSIN